MTEVDAVRSAAALDHLDRLVSIPSLPARSNREILDYATAVLAEAGVESQCSFHDDGERGNLIAVIGPQLPGGVMLNGHTDVVPVDGQEWATDPFTVVEKDGKYFGRGCVDMKSFDALAIWAMVEAAQGDIKRPLQLALTYDEEVGLIGVDPLLNDAKGKFPKGSAAIIGEPSMLQVVTGHKSGLGFDVHVIGFEIHSSIAYQGVSAIMEGAKLIIWGNEMNAEGMARTPQGVNALFDPPWTNVHVGMIQGGTAHNITAKDCRFALTFRCVPGDDPADWERRFRAKVAQVQAEMQAVRPEARIEISERFNAKGLAPEHNGAAEHLTRMLTGDNATHVVSYGTEAGYFQAHGYSAVVCGPGDIAQAHQPDEFITIDQFNAGHAFMSRLLDHLKEG